MPIKIPNDLPARAVLERERVDVISESDALRQDIRPMQVALLNLMPDKLSTETQLLRVIGHTPLQIELTLVRTGTYEAKNTRPEHLMTFYKTWEEVRHHCFDGLIVTGAPVEHLSYEEVVYWEELGDILDWAETHVYGSFFICWGAQAALYHHHGIPKHNLSKKLFGVFPHRTLRRFEPLTAGFDDWFDVPVSRYTEIRHEEVAKVPEIDILADSEESGLCLLHEPRKRRVYMFNHLEYDAETLKREYLRDRKAGLGTALPCNYFPGNDPEAAPRMTWRAHRNLLFGNWIDLLYQGTPFDLQELPRIRRRQAPAPR